MLREAIRGEPTHGQATKHNENIWRLVAVQFAFDGRYCDGILIFSYHTAAGLAIPFVRHAAAMCYLVEADALIRSLDAMR